MFCFPRDFALVVGLITLGLAPVGSAQASHSDYLTRCQALEGADFSDLPDAPTQVTDVILVDAKTDRPAYCEIRGYVAPSVGFALRMPPERWNGKFIELGCGGSCGSTKHISACDNPLRRGYACIVSDGGHKSNGHDMKWAYHNPQAVIESMRASHVTAIAGKGIVAHYYGKEPDKSYFMGCSGGGWQAMREAQTFPWDFNGIVAGAPGPSFSGVFVNWLWANRALTRKDGEPLLSDSDFELLHRAVIARCDMNDGVKDGVIGDPRVCRFDPSELRCSTGKSGNCLTAPQIEAVNKIYDGPVNSKGERISRPSALRGSELDWPWYEGSSKAPTRAFNYLKEWPYFSIYPIDLRPAWEPKHFDFDRDYNRVEAMDALTSNNPDLRRFKSLGGKLLAYAGWMDALGGVLNTADYYESVEKIMGGRGPTQEFFRLFMVPGMDHCTAGDGAYAIDYLSALEAWVERGKAPEKLIGFHLTPTALNRHEARDEASWDLGLEFPLDTAEIEFSRPIYPYPMSSKYLGHGDPNQATSFGPVQP